MTDPVILLGTQSNGETLPVQVNEFGQLVAEGLPGPPGPEGPPGPDSVVLPPDPYEGALLGWLNDELAWVGTPPVPIPPGVFGPIIDWSSENGLLTVEGEIPAAVGNGVYVWQCDPDGTYFTEGWNTSQNWSDTAWTNPTSNPTYPGANAFDGSLDTRTGGDTDNYSVYTFNPPLVFTDTVRIYGDLDTRSSPKADIKANNTSVTGFGDGIAADGANKKWYTVLTGGGTLTSVSMKSSPGTYWAFIYAIEVDGKLLVDTRKSLNMRVQQVLNNSLLGVSSNSGDFTIGKYLKVPEQRVAPWVLYGNDPTSLIDRLRQKRD